jgi:hypothetical protein
MNNRRLRDILVLMFRVKNNSAPRYFMNLYEINRDKMYNLRYSDFRIPRYNTVAFGRYFHGRNLVRIKKCQNVINRDNF